MHAGGAATGTALLLVSTSAAQHVDKEHYSLLNCLHRCVAATAC